MRYRQGGVQDRKRIGKDQEIMGKPRCQFGATQENLQA